jgi:hypothetical protein
LIEATENEQEVYSFVLVRGDYGQMLVSALDTGVSAVVTHNGWYPENKGDPIGLCQLLKSRNAPVVA